MEIGGIELASLKVEIKADIAGFKSQMEQAKTAGVSAANEMSAGLSKAANVGTKLSSMGSTLTKTVTLPVAAAGVAAVKMALDYESSFAKVSTLLDDGRTDYNAYSKAILDGSTKMKTGVNNYSEAVYQSISAGIDQTNAVEFTNKAIKLAKGGFTDAAKAVDIMTTAINGYSLETSDATKISDLLITTQNLGKTTVDELASSMGKVIPVASSVNFNMTELSTSYAVLTKNGIATAEAGTYLRQMLSELGSAGSTADKALRELAGKGFADLKAEGVPTSDILKMLSQYAEASGMTLKDMFGSVEAGSAAMVMAKQDGAEYNEILAEMEQSAGATQAAYDKMDATKAERLSGAVNSIKNSTIELAEVATPFVETVAGGLETLADQMSAMDEGQQQLVVGGLAVAASLGPLLSIAGKGVTLFTKLAPLVKGGSAAMSTFAGSAATAGTAAAGAATATEAAAAGTTAAAGGATAAAGGFASVLPVVALAAGAVAGLGYTVKKTYDYFAGDTTDKGDIFNKYSADLKSVGDAAQYASGSVTEGGGVIPPKMKEISDATKEAAGAYIELDNTARNYMLSLQYTNTTITDEIVADMTGKFGAMADSINSKLDEGYQQDLAALQSYFDANTTMTAEEQAQMLANLDATYANKKASVQSYEDQIIAIAQQASAENRQTTAEENAEMARLQEEMRTTAVTLMSQTEDECTVILNRLKESEGQITAEAASEAIKNANTARDNTIQAANDQYDGIVTAAQRMLEAGAITQQEYNEMVNEAERSKNSQIGKAMAASDGVRDAIASKSPEIIGKVNAQTGEIASRWDTLVGNVQGTWNRFTLQDKNANVNTNANDALNIVKRFADWWDSWWPGSKTATVNTGGGGGGGGGGSFYNGIDYVPYDGYRAVLHKGESVKTAEETKAMRQGSGPGGGREIKQEFNFYNSTDSPYEIGRIAEQAMRDMQFKGVL